MGNACASSANRWDGLSAQQGKEDLGQSAVEHQPLTDDALEKSTNRVEGCDSASRCDNGEALPSSPPPPGPLNSLGLDLFTPTPLHTSVIMDQHQHSESTMNTDEPSSPASHPALSSHPSANNSVSHRASAVTGGALSSANKLTFSVSALPPRGAHQTHPQQHQAQPNASPSGGGFSRLGSLSGTSNNGFGSPMTFSVRGDASTNTSSLHHSGHQQHHSSVSRHHTTTTVSATGTDPSVNAVILEFDTSPMSSKSTADRSQHRSPPDDESCISSHRFVLNPSSSSSNVALAGDPPLFPVPYKQRSSMSDTTTATLRNDSASQTQDVVIADDLVGVNTVGMGSLSSGKNGLAVQRTEGSPSRWTLGDGTASFSGEKPALRPPTGPRLNTQDPVHEELSVSFAPSVTTMSGQLQHYHHPHRLEYTLNTNTDGLSCGGEKSLGNMSYQSSLSTREPSSAVIPELVSGTRPIMEALPRETEPSQLPPACRDRSFPPVASSNGTIRVAQEVPRSKDATINKLDVKDVDLAGGGPDDEDGPSLPVPRNRLQQVLLNEDALLRQRREHAASANTKQSFHRSSAAIVATYLQEYQLRSPNDLSVTPPAHQHLVQQQHRFPSHLKASFESSEIEESADIIVENNRTSEKKKTGETPLDATSSNEEQPTPSGSSADKTAEMQFDNVTYSGNTGRLVNDKNGAVAAPQLLSTPLVVESTKGDSGGVVTVLGASVDEDVGQYPHGGSLAGEPGSPKSGCSSISVLDNEQHISNSRV